MWIAAPLSLVWAIWKEINKLIFHDETFSLNRLKISFISVVISWAGLIAIVECSFVRILLCIL